jgi:hypothetical protein
MGKILKFLAYTTAIVCGLWSLVSCLELVASLYGFTNTILALILSPLLVALLPLYLALANGYWPLFVITYGGGTIASLLYSIGSKLDGKDEIASSNENESNQAWRFSNKHTKGNTVSKANFKPGDVIVTDVVGVTFEGRQEIIRKLSPSCGLILAREHDNPHDKNAIKVCTAVHSEEEKARLWSEPIKPDQPFSEMREEIYRQESIGYINRGLAEKIAPIFDEYARGPNEIIFGKILAITSTPNPAASYGVKITFKLPTEDDLNRAMEKKLYSMPPH